MDKLIDRFDKLTRQSSDTPFAEDIVRSYASRANALLPDRLGKLLSSMPTNGSELVVSLRDANPLNLVLLAVALYLLATLVLPESVSKGTPTLARARSSACHAGNSYSFLPEQHPPVTMWQKYTPRTLAVHDGSGAKQKGGSKQKGEHDASNKILLAIDGRVFDVTKGGNFYGPGGPYGNFAGRDASRGMAKQSFDLDMLTPLDKPLDKLDDLSQTEVSNMKEWISHFSSKYTVVGELVNEGEEGGE